MRRAFNADDTWEIPEGFVQQSRRTVLRRLEDNGFRATTVKKLQKFFKTNYFPKLSGGSTDHVN